ncbi:single-stranded DNA-binding protein [Streptomyces sp. NBC_00572]|uniref:single-stranded DNA-binding protein n=1 Tax=Streptomyces sp. NBC_00572 TaxID=2903664 RepID=UPI002257C577|nr:single-stranded DNA-binding protein [Streptomyces sp. NBC_00572]MCX4987145.1 single-stranded DNA-binding protein [Streptomyces sp. NBC_00572]
MAGETTITIAGNLVDDPELRHTGAGHAVAKFRIASTPRTYDKQSGQWQDGESLFMTVTAWRSLGENVAASIQRGARVVVVGTLRQRSYEDNQGVKRTVVEIEAEEVAPSLRNATAQVTKTTGNRQGGNSQQAQGGYGQQQPQYDQWNTGGPAY